MNNWGAVLALALSACVIDSDSSPSNRDPEPTARVRSCGPFGCLQNTATGPDDEVFNELDASGTFANADGVKIMSFKLRDGTPATLHAKGDRLMAKGASGALHLGTELDGSVLVLSKHDVPAFEAKFSVDTVGVAFWGGDTSETVEVYDIQVRKFGISDAKPACRDNLPNMDEWPGNPHAAVVFEGDRFHHEAHTVSDSVGSPWFNIACAGGYPAKLHLLRHTWAGGFSKLDGVQYWPTTLAQRQTYLRAITADYHGDGAAHTLSGVPLFYGDAAGIHPMASGGTIEAIWKENGAVCLNEPRVVTRTSIESRGIPIPRCHGVVNWFEMGYVLTVVPPP
ncbi:MAG: ADYC domain-containing protein [Kofleriaceae bacterium]